MKQSNQFYLPKVNPITSFDDFLKSNKDYKLIAHLKNSNSFNKKSIASKDKIVVMIGPEGGFSEEEIFRASKEKIKEISFGKNRLRSETAGVFAVSIINNYKICVEKNYKVKTSPFLILSNVTFASSLNSVSSSLVFSIDSNDKSYFSLNCLKTFISYEFKPFSKFDFVFSLINFNFSKRLILFVSLSFIYF